MLRRSFRIALFWAGLKFVFDALGLVWSAYGSTEGAIALQAALSAPLPGYAYAAGLLFVRLLALMLAALALTLAFSTRSLALALGWFLRPLGAERAWKPALAFALMAQYLPRIHRVAAQTRLAAQSRRLPSSGLAYWKLAFPQMFRILAESTWSQAVGIAGRGLDRAEAWQNTQPLLFSQLLFGAAVGIVILLPLFCC